jgi:hypothetical protein
VIVPERVADAIEEIARPNRDDQQEKPQIQADPALRRPRLVPRPWPPYLVEPESRPRSGPAAEE